MRTTPIIGVWTAMYSMSVMAAPPPAPDSLTENSAALWDAAADSATANVFDDASRVQVGSSSVRFETDGGFDTWLWSPPGLNAGWNMLIGGAGGFAFWSYAENFNLGFQGGSPWIRFYTAPGDYIEYRSTNDALNDARNQWVEFVVPYAGSSAWSRTIQGSPTLSNVAFIELHADTWEAGFKWWIDGLRFDEPAAPPQGVVAIARNHSVSLSWQAYDDPVSTFDHYAVYRSTSAFSSVGGTTPIDTVAGIGATAFEDNTALNGVPYHYAVTAVFSDSTETTNVSSIGPRTPRDETDLQVVSIARTPRYPRFDPVYSYYEITEPSGFGPYVVTAATGLGSGQTGSTQRWPNINDPVTYTATVRNRGTNPWSGALVATWAVDGMTVSQLAPMVSLQPGQTTALALVRPWDGLSHEICITLDHVDARAANNTFAIDTKSVAFLSYVDETRIESFREESPGYPNPVTDDFLDWLNLHMQRFNELFVDAGCLKRVHYDVLEVISDSAPDPTVDTQPFAIFPFRFRASEGTLRLSGYYDFAEDLDYGLLHENGHQLGLIDLYRLNMGPGENQVSGQGYNAVDCLMNGVSHYLSGHSALAMTHWLDQAHGYFGQYLYAMPSQVRMRFLGSDGQPLSGATVYVYQKVERPGIGEVITDQVKAQGITDANGIYTLPNVPINPTLVPPTYAGDELNDNPFGYVAVVGTNGLLHFKVEKDGFTDYAWLEITEVNNAYRLGQTVMATFDRQLSLGGVIQNHPPCDMAEVNANTWATWAQDGTMTVFDDNTVVQTGAASVRGVATGGFDNYIRYPGTLLAQWDLTGLMNIRLWVRAQNDNVPGFQDFSPRVRLGSAVGYFEWRPPYDVLNDAIGQWVELVIPAAGSGFWTRTTTGTPTLAEIHYLEIHADTWGAGFVLWVDGVRLELPDPCQTCSSVVDCTDQDACTFDACAATVCSNAPVEFGDVNGHGPVQADLDDILCVLGGFSLYANCPNADIAPTTGPAACQGDGVVNLDDILAVLAAFTGADPCGCTP